jgi:hypothetical protein
MPRSDHPKPLDHRVGDLIQREGAVCPTYADAYRHTFGWTTSGDPASG